MAAGPSRYGQPGSGHPVVAATMVLSHMCCETGPRMSDQLGEEVPLEPVDPWGSVRRVREPLAWVLLIGVAIAVLVSAVQLFGLVGVPVPVPSGPGQAGVTLG